jgi:hypothetical protein
MAFQGLSFEWIWYGVEDTVGWLVGWLAIG